jgi:hypothetical protein
MENSTTKNQVQQIEAPIKNETEVTRRGFGKTLAGLGFFSGLAALSTAKPAYAWLDGGFQGREDVQDALRALVKTYSNVRPYLHKFNDALVKAHLRNLDFAKKHGLEKDFADHEAQVLGAVFERHINPAIQKTGQKDMFLWGVFERTSCSYQLYEWINVKPGERTFPCPYKPILDEIDKGLGTYTITWNDVCNKWCKMRWEAFSKKAGDIKFGVQPGETCKVYIV